MSSDVFPTSTGRHLRISDHGDRGSRGHTPITSCQNNKVNEFYKNTSYSFPFIRMVKEEKTKINQLFSHGKNQFLTNRAASWGIKCESF